MIRIPALLFDIRRYVFLLTVFSWGAITGFAQDSFSLQIDSILSASPGFSGEILITKDRGNAILYSRTWGYRNTHTKDPILSGDVYELASISKTFTAAAIMLLEQEGKLGFDDLLSRFVSVPYPGIRIRHLLNHTSGLPDYQQVMDMHWDKSKVAGNPEIIAFLNTFSPAALFAPGERYLYSNTGYVLLGSIVEKVSGEDFTTFCNNRIFNPLGMTRTGIRTNAEKKSMSSFALGHIWVDSAKRFIRADSFPSSDYTIWLGNRKGPGRVSSTVQDLSRWDRALYQQKLLSQEAIQEAFTPATLHDGKTIEYGMGWMLNQHPQLGKIVWHSGDNPGYSTRLMRYVDKGITIIILNNNAYPKFNAMIDQIENILSKLP